MVVSKEEVHVAHSPDSDDAFMFYGIACGAVPTGDFAVRQVMKDIQTLNEEAMEGKYEVSAVSFAAYPYIHSQYLLLPYGSSFGIGWGPIIVVPEKQNIPPKDKITVAIPGKMTTAYLLLRMAMPNIHPIMLPFDEIIPAVQNKSVQAGLIIHEGQLTHAEAGLKKILDLGEWWQDKTGLPVPLGANVIRRDLGKDKITKLSRMLKESIVYSLENRKDAMNYALSFARGMSHELADQYIDMYVNELSVDCGDLGKKAVHKLFDLASQTNIIDKNFTIEFAD